MITRRALFGLATAVPLVGANRTASAATCETLSLSAIPVRRAGKV